MAMCIGESDDHRPSLIETSVQRYDPLNQPYDDHLRC
jgi:hypothetical protein